MTDPTTLREALDARLAEYNAECMREGKHSNANEFLDRLAPKLEAALHRTHRLQLGEHAREDVIAYAIAALRGSEG